MPPAFHPIRLLVGIDTEGDNQWDAAARARQRFENHLRAAEVTCALRQARRAADLRHYVSGRDRRPIGRCPAWSRGGRRLRDWRSSSCLGDATVFGCRRRRNTDMRRTCRWRSSSDQLASLTDAIASAFGAPPVSYRSGRFGFSAAHVFALERRGYQVESSVAPLFYEAHKHGPDFVEAPLKPYFLSYDSATTPGTSNLLEIPVSAALNVRLPRRLQYLYARAPRPYTTKRVLRKLGLARVRWLRPSYSSLEDMVSLARDLAPRPTAGPEPAVSFERGDRRRQPVQPDGSGARGVSRSAGAVLRVRPAGARSVPATSPSSSARIRRRIPDAHMRIVHVTPHLPPDQAANALLPYQLGQLGARARRRGRVHRASAAGRTRRAELRRPGHLDSRSDAAGFFERTLRARLDCRRAGASGSARRPRRSSAPTSCTCTATGCWRKCVRGWRPARASRSS